MLDFLKIRKELKKGIYEICPKFIICKSKDLMIRGGDFYAIWDERSGLWSTDEFVAMNIIDREIDEYYKNCKDEIEGPCKVMHVCDGDTNANIKWRTFVTKQMPDFYHPLDEKIIFLDTKTTREDYASHRLPYPLKESSIEAYENLMSVLYSEEEKRKIEWAIGAIVANESKWIQKFLVLYGSAGTGKSTVLNIIQDLFEDYYCSFDAKSLASKSDAFALEPFSNNPLVAIQHDGDLSKIEDNTRLNSIVSHESMVVNQKFKSLYSMKFNAFLFMGTNNPVKITNAKSGLLRRLIDVTPTGNKIPYATYMRLNNQIKFELSGIAWHCMQVYKENPEYYANYIPTNMMSESNDFYNFVSDSLDILNNEDGVTLTSAWELYKTYCSDANVPYPYSKMRFKSELLNYYESFNERYTMPDGTRVRSCFTGFKMSKFDYPKEEVKIEKVPPIKFEEQESIFDKECNKCKAQYASEQETPMMKWDDVDTKLTDIDTHKLHYVRVPKNHIVIDFDLKNKNGEKDFKKNLEAASKWPKTYAELSKSGQGIHLHYLYTGDVEMLSRVYAENIEVKVFTGKSSLRRKLTKCNNLEIATLDSGLPLKEEAKTVNFDGIKNEKALRASIERNLRKEIHASTKPSVDFINKILTDAYNNGLKYDVTDMRPRIYAFAANSSHQSDYCIKMVGKMKFKSDAPSESPVQCGDDDIIFYDVEVFPNLFIVVWKKRGKSNKCVKMINSSPTDVENLLKFKLVGFNCRRYDNHIMYARMMGYNNLQLYELSQRIINKSPNCFFGEAYNLSYTDIYDFSSKKQSLKKFEIELGIHHQECGIPWDQPVPEDKWHEVADYCCNDVLATEATFESRKGDWLARQILADLAGMTVNDTTNSLTTRIIFGKERHPKLIYTDLATGEQY